MLNNISIGKYILGNGIVYRLSPMFKVLSVIIMTTGIFFIDSYDDVLMLFFYLLLAIMYSDINIFIYFKNIYGIRLFLLFILIIDIIFFSTISRIVFDLFKLVFIVVYTSIFMYTTKMMEACDGIYKLFKPISSRIARDISMIVVLTIRYIPTLILEGNRIIRAQKIRGFDFEKENFRGKIDMIPRMLSSMFALSIKRANDSSDIMDLRLYNYSFSRSSYRDVCFGWIDGFLLVLNILILIVVIVY